MESVLDNLKSKATKTLPTVLVPLFLALGAKDADGQNNNEVPVTVNQNGQQINLQDGQGTEIKYGTIPVYDEDAMIIEKDGKKYYFMNSYDYSNQTEIYNNLTDEQKEKLNDCENHVFTTIITINGRKFQSFFSMYGFPMQYKETEIYPSSWAADITDTGPLDLSDFKSVYGEKITATCTDKALLEKHYDGNYTCTIEHTPIYKFVPLEDSSKTNSTKSEYEHSGDYAIGYTFSSTYSPSYEGSSEYEFYNSSFDSTKNSYTTPGYGPSHYDQIMNEQKAEEERREKLPKFIMYKGVKYEYRPGARVYGRGKVIFVGEHKDCYEECLESDTTKSSFDWDSSTPANYNITE